MRPRFRMMQFRMPVRDPTVEYKRFPEEWPAETPRKRPARATTRAKKANPPRTAAPVINLVESQTQFPTVEESESEFAPETQLPRSDSSSITTPSASEGEADRIMGRTPRKRAPRRKRRIEDEMGMLPLTAESKKIHESGNYYHGPAPRAINRKRGRPFKDSCPQLEESPYGKTQKDFERLSRRARGLKAEPRVTRGQRKRKELEVHSSPIRTRARALETLYPNVGRRRSLDDVIPATESSDGLSSIEDGPPRKLTKFAGGERRSNRQAKRRVTTVESEAAPARVLDTPPAEPAGTMESVIHVRSSISPNPPSPTFKTVHESPLLVKNWRGASPEIQDSYDEQELDSESGTSSPLFVTVASQRSLLEPSQFQLEDDYPGAMAAEAQVVPQDAVSEVSIEIQDSLDPSVYPITDAELEGEIKKDAVESDCIVVKDSFSTSLDKPLKQQQSTSSSNYISLTPSNNNKPAASASGPAQTPITAPRFMFRSQKVGTGSDTPAKSPSSPLRTRTQTSKTLSARPTPVQTHSQPPTVSFLSSTASDLIPPASQPLPTGSTTSENTSAQRSFEDLRPRRRRVTPPEQFVFSIDSMNSATEEDKVKGIPPGWR